MDCGHNAPWNERQQPNGLMWNIKKDTQDFNASGCHRQSLRLLQDGLLSVWTHKFPFALHHRMCFDYDKQDTVAQRHGQIPADVDN